MEIPFQIGRTLISQGHLVPMHMIPMPVYWAYDHALQLYPLPDLIVLGDNTKAFATEIQGCQLMNVVSCIAKDPINSNRLHSFPIPSHQGSFAKHHYSFKVYVPHNRTVEDSAIPEEEDS